MSDTERETKPKERSLPIMTSNKNTVTEIVWRSAVYAFATFGFVSVVARVVYFWPGGGL
jgi:hypothetical protein